MAKVMLATGMIVAYGYIDGDVHGVLQRQPVRKVHDDEPHDGTVRGGLLDADRLQPGDSAGAVVAAGAANTPALLFSISLVVNIGMWLERFVIIVVSLSRDFVPSAWDDVLPHEVGLGDAISGTFGLFFTLFYLFIRFLPMISIVEVRSLVHETDEEKHAFVERAVLKRIDATDLPSQHEPDRAGQHLWRGGDHRRAGVRAV